MKIRGLVSYEQPQWESLYRGYAASYKVDTDDAKPDRLSTWLLDASHPCEGLSPKLMVDKRQRVLLLAWRISGRCHHPCAMLRLVSG